MNKVILMGRLTRDPVIKYTGVNTDRHALPDILWQWTGEEEKKRGSRQRTTFHALHLGKAESSQKST